MAKKVKGKKPTKRAEVKSVNSGPRVRNLTKKQRRIKAKKEVNSRQPLSGSFKLIAQVIKLLRQHWRILGGIVLVYLVLNIVFASGVSNISSAVSTLKDNLSGSTNLSSAFSGFGSLVGSSGASSSTTGSALQSVLIVLESLVIIWALRQLLADETIKVKQAYYRSSTPLIPFILVIFMIIIQLLPITFGAAVLSAVLTSAFSTGPLVTLIFGTLFALMAAWSIYMVSGSIFALYIVTLPDMQPRQALRSAKNLVRFRRWPVIRKMLFLPIFILVVMGVLIIPLILYATFLVVPVFYVLSMLTILFVHAYLYSLYRELIK
jgi:hypothetical protein